MAVDEPPKPITWAPWIGLPLVSRTVPLIV
jgi:hypothetical protein